MIKLQADIAEAIYEANERRKNLIPHLGRAIGK